MATGLHSNSFLLHFDCTAGHATVQDINISVQSTTETTKSHFDIVHHTYTLSLSFCNDLALDSLCQPLRRPQERTVGLLCQLRSPLRHTRHSLDRLLKSILSSISSLMVLFAFCMLSKGSSQMYTWTISFSLLFVLSPYVFVDLFGRVFSDSPLLLCLLFWNYLRDKYVKRTSKHM